MKRKIGIFPFTKSFLAAISLLAAVSLLTACQPPLQTPGLLSWRYADLRALQQPSSSDNADSAWQLVALYTRQVNSELQVRLDLLDFSVNDPVDLYLALDTAPGGTRALPGGAQAGLDWDSLISLPALGPVQAMDADGKPITGLKVRVERDPIQDEVVISLDGTNLPRGLAGYSLQAFAFHPGDSKPVSSIGPVQANALPPSAAQVLIAFWDTLSAATPAQALRAWDGAHTGPLNGRHGLRHLIGAASINRFPIYLLDLKTPESLSALDTVGGLKMVRKLEDQGILILPDAQPLSSGPPGSPFTIDDWTVKQSIQDSRQASDQYGFPTSQGLYSLVLSPADTKKDYPLLFMPASQSSSTFGQAGEITGCQRWQDQSVIPLPTAQEAIPAEEQQANQDGPSLAVRRRLLETALQPDQAPDSFLILGGDLGQSTWGDPTVAQATLSFFSNHPWIHPVTMDELLGCHPGHSYQPPARQASVPFVPGTPQEHPIASHLDVSQIQALIVKEFQQAPAGRLREAAWQAYRTLLAPGQPNTAELWKLRSGFLAPVGYLLAANRWAQQPVQAGVDSEANPVRFQAEDVDWDGQAEMILSSNTMYAVVEPDGGYIAAAFYRDGQGVHQWIGSTSQFTTGLSDPTEWRSERGPAGDPNQVRGAFSEIPLGYISPSWEPYQAAWQEGILSLSSPDGQVEKIIRLLPDGFSVSYASVSPIQVQIPLVIDPWTRAQPGWEANYTSLVTPPTWTWGLTSSIRVSLQTTASLEPQAFTDSQQALLAPENPNFNFTPGHYLPYPVALGVVQGEGEFWIEVRVIR